MEALANRSCGVCQEWRVIPAVAGLIASTMAVIFCFIENQPYLAILPGVGVIGCIYLLTFVCEAGAKIKLGEHVEEFGLQLGQLKETIGSIHEKFRPLVSDMAVGVERLHTHAEGHKKDFDGIVNQLNGIATALTGIVDTQQVSAMLDQMNEKIEALSQEREKWAEERAKLTTEREAFNKMKGEFETIKNSMQADIAQLKGQVGIMTQNNAGAGAGQVQVGAHGATMGTASHVRSPSVGSPLRVGVTNQAPLTRSVSSRLTKGTITIMAGGGASGAGASPSARPGPGIGPGSARGTPTKE